MADMMIGLPVCNGESAGQVSGVRFDVADAVICTTFWHVCSVCWQVKKAFLALVQNGVRAAVLWDSGKQDFVGKYRDLIRWLHCALAELQHSVL